ncbi:antA/AntB antirepressor family protein, partial [Yersinia enterocolitica]
MTNQLIPVFDGTISNETTLLCNARDLHSFLGVGKRFASWITERISEYEFVENQDYVIFSQNREKIGRGRPSIDYHLTLDTAKELAMVERNEKGRQIRRYFIECEKRLHQRKPLQTHPVSQSEIDAYNINALAQHYQVMVDAWSY